MFEIEWKNPAVGQGYPSFAVEIFDSDDFSVGAAEAVSAPVGRNQELIALGYFEISSFAYVKALGIFRGDCR